MSTYKVGAVVAPDPDGGYIAHVVDGHAKVKDLFAFASDPSAALRELARTVAIALKHSRYQADHIRTIVVYVVEVNYYKVADLHEA